MHHGSEREKGHLTSQDGGLVLGESNDPLVAGLVCLRNRAGKGGPERACTRSDLRSAKAPSTNQLHTLAIMTLTAVPSDVR